MGVKLNVDALDGVLYGGGTASAHALLAAQIDRKIVAIDASHWLYQSHNMARTQAYLAKDRDDPGAALRKSAAVLFTDRCIQLLRYGAHPLVV
jgi:5'-3' exonuclease